MWLVRSIQVVTESAPERSKTLGRPRETAPTTPASPRRGCYTQNARDRKRLTMRALRPSTRAHDTTQTRPKLPRRPERLQQTGTEKAPPPQEPPRSPPDLHFRAFWDGFGKVRGPIFREVVHGFCAPTEATKSNTRPKEIK